MKKKLIGMLVVLLALTMVLGACGGGGGGGGSQDEALVGMWVWDEGEAYEYHFNADGTGTRGAEALDMVEEFTWTTNNDELRMNITGGINERWTYVIADGVLTITSRQATDMEYSYIKVPEFTAPGANHTLVGAWAWDEGEAYEYLFNANGTGRRGVEMTDETDEFVWVTEGNVLWMHIDGDIVRERWTFVIANDVLTLTSRQGWGAFSYLSIPAFTAPGADHILVGTWAWDANAEYEYVLNADGTGTRGVASAGLIDELLWVTVDDGIWMNITDGMTERWTFVVENDVLTITSRQVPGMEWSYIRVG